MTAIDVEVQVGTAPQVDVDVQLAAPTFTIVSVLPTGPRGPAGPQGDEGDPGPTGSTGATGPKGDKGDTGNTGAAGSNGAAGATGAKGDKGDPGDPGADGADGAPGVGVPTGGTAGQVLAKDSNADFDTEWVDPSGGSGLPPQWDEDDSTGAVVARVDDVAETALTIEGIASQTAPLFPIVAQIPQRASLVTATGVLTGQPLTFYATTNGVAGNDLSVEIIDPGTANAVFDASVVGDKLTISLATDSGSVITTTQADIRDAVSAPLFVPTATNDNLTLAEAMAETALSGGSDTTTLLVVAANGQTTFGGVVHVIPPTSLGDWDEGGAFVVHSPPDLFDEQGDDVSVFTVLDPYNNHTLDLIASGELILTSSPGRTGGQLEIRGDVFAGGGKFKVEDGGYVTLTQGVDRPPMTLLMRNSDVSAYHSIALDLIQWFNGLARVLPSGAIGTSAGEPDDADINPGECFRWFDPTAGDPKVMFKAKDADGDVFVMTMPMEPA